MYNFLSGHKTSPNIHPPILPQQSTKTKNYNGFGWSLYDYNYVRLILKK